MSTPNPGDGRVYHFAALREELYLAAAHENSPRPGQVAVASGAHRHAPKSIMERPKMGFGVPIDVWLRGPLKPWAAALIEPGRLARESYFDPAPIQRKWIEHQSGSRNWSYYLWDVLMFPQWQEHNA